MATMGAHGIEARLPAGFEGHIYRRLATGAEQAYPVAQFATFALPPDIGDFGGGAVTLMGPSDVFAVFFEYGPESVGTTLFSRSTMPKGLAESHFRPYLLRRGLTGQAGTQWFFTEGGRPFTFYAVLGAYARRGQLVPMVNELLDNVTIVPAALVTPVSAQLWN